MKPELLNLGETALQLHDKWLSTYSAIQAIGVGGSATNGRTPDQDLNDVNARVSGALSSTGALVGATREQLELLGLRLPAIKVALDALETLLTAILPAIEPLHGATSTDQNGHLQLQIQHTDKGTITFDLGTPLAAVVQQANVLLDALPYVSKAMGEQSFSVFVGLTKSAAEQLLSIQASARQAGKELKATQLVNAEVQKIATSAGTLSQQIQEILTSATAQKATTDTNVAEIEQKLARAREVSKDADALQLRVTGFVAQFEAFETQMKARLEQFAAFEKSTKDAQKINEEREAKILGLIDKADTMIRGATTAGLSQSLEETKNLYEKRLETTQKYFLGSVGVLLVCSLPIAAQIVPGPWQQYFPAQATASASDAGPWLAAFGKLMLVIPATWATAFFASNYAELFHLAREYGHKAALAKSVDGFKREAPNYEQEIVGSVFMEIQDNPGSRKAPPPATPQNPIAAKFLTRVLEAMKLVKGKA
jgi:hypothetical protein